MKVIGLPVDILALFLIDQIPRPLRFRFDDERGVRHVIKVGEILSVEEQSGWKHFYQYACRGPLGGQIRYYDIRFYIDDIRWELYRVG